MLYKANLFLIHTLMFMQFILCFSLVVSSLTFENTTLFHSTLILIKHVKYYSIQQKSCVLVLSSSSVCIQKLYNTMLYNTIYYYYFVPSILISQLFSSTQCHTMSSYYMHECIYSMPSSYPIILHFVSNF